MIQSHRSGPTTFFFKKKKKKSVREFVLRVQARNKTKVKKGKISPVHAMKAYTERRGTVPFILNLGIRHR
jgi:hypothetical protein